MLRLLCALQIVATCVGFALPKCTTTDGLCGSSNSSAPACCGSDTCSAPPDCGGPAPPPAVYTCRAPPPPPPPGCHAEGQKCQVDGDCCEDVCNETSCQDATCTTLFPPTSMPTMLNSERSAPLTEDVATAATKIYNALYQERIGDGPAPTLPCILGHCFGKIAACMLDTSCRRGMLCTKDCSGTNQTCIFQCTSDFENEVYDNMIRCFFSEHDCMKMPKGQTFQPYGACRPVDQTTILTEYLGEPLTAEKTKTLLTRNGKDQGYWLVARGASHAYDCFDCQNDYFSVGGPSQPVATNASNLAYTSIYKVHKSDGTFRWNKAEYLAEFDTFPQAGRMHMHAPDYGGLVHDEDWRVLAVDERTEDDPQWIALYYCGGAPGVKETYEGACVMTPDGMMPSDPAESKKIETVYSKAGVTLACIPNNTAAACQGHPSP